MRKSNEVKKQKLEDRVKEIITLSIQKFFKNLENNLVISTVDIINEKMKRKIIKKEGINIKSFEKETAI